MSELSFIGAGEAEEEADEGRGVGGGEQPGHRRDVCSQLPGTGR